MVSWNAMKSAVLSSDHTLAVGGSEKTWVERRDSGGFLRVAGSRMLRASVVETANIAVWAAKETGLEQK